MVFTPSKSRNINTQSDQFNENNLTEDNVKVSYIEGVVYEERNYLIDYQHAGKYIRFKQDSQFFSDFKTKRLNSQKRQNQKKSIFDGSDISTDFNHIILRLQNQQEQIQ